LSFTSSGGGGTLNLAGGSAPSAVNPTINTNGSGNLTVGAVGTTVTVQTTAAGGMVVDGSTGTLTVNAGSTLNTTAGNLSVNWN
ncbi:hypothetical protein ABTE85_22305, partial [Acinetobacter baumannii]